MRQKLGFRCCPQNILPHIAHLQESKVPVSQARRALSTRRAFSVAADSRHLEGQERVRPSGSSGVAKLSRIGGESSRWPGQVPASWWLGPEGQRCKTGFSQPLSPLVSSHGFKKHNSQTNFWGCQVREKAGWVLKTHLLAGCLEQCSKVTDRFQKHADTPTSQVDTLI